MQQNKKSWSSYLRLPLLCILAAIIGINVYTWNASRLVGDAFPMPLGFGVTVVLSGSMEPALSTGDLLLVVEQEQYEEKEIVVFQSGRSAVVHRIMSIDGDTVTTQGDANNVADEPFSKNLICGKVVLAIPILGYLVSIIKTPIGTVALLAVAVWLMNRSYRQEQQKKETSLAELREEIEKLKSESQQED